MAIILDSERNGKCTGITITLAFIFYFAVCDPLTFLREILHRSSVSFLVSNFLWLCALRVSLFFFFLFKFLKLFVVQHDRKNVGKKRECSRNSGFRDFFYFVYSL